MFIGDGKDRKPERTENEFNRINQITKEIASHTCADNSAGPDGNIRGFGGDCLWTYGQLLAGQAGRQGKCVYHSGDVDGMREQIANHLKRDETNKREPIFKITDNSNWYMLFWIENRIPFVFGYTV